MKRVEFLHPSPGLKNAPHNAFPGFLETSEEFHRAVPKVVVCCDVQGVMAQRVMGLLWSMMMNPEAPLEVTKSPAITDALQAYAHCKGLVDDHITYHYMLRCTEQIRAGTCVLPAMNLLQRLACATVGLLPPSDHFGVRSGSWRMLGETVCSSGEWIWIYTKDLPSLILFMAGVLHNRVREVPFHFLILLTAMVGFCVPRLHGRHHIKNQCAGGIVLFVESMCVWAGARLHGWVGSTEGPGEGLWHPGRCHPQPRGTSPSSPRFSKHFLVKHKRVVLPAKE